MRIIFSIFFIVLVSHYSLGQATIYLDENGNKVNQIKFRKKWNDKDLLLSRWDSIGKNKKRYATLKKNLYMKGSYDFDNIKNHLESIINKQIPNNNSILIRYSYKNDLCSTIEGNNWTKSEIQSRKKFFESTRANLVNDNIFFIVLFEKHLILNNDPNNEEEYFFIDKDNYFRDKLFTNQTLCGSYALIKNNGQTLIRNGEYRADWMAQHLLPENWSLFFEPQD